MSNFALVSKDGTKIDFLNNLDEEELEEVTDADVRKVLNETNLENVVDINLRWCKQIADETVFAIA